MSSDLNRQFKEFVEDKQRFAPASPAPQQPANTEGGVIETREELEMVVIDIMGMSQSIDEQRCPNGFNDMSDQVAKLTRTIKRLKGWAER